MLHLFLILYYYDSRQLAFLEYAKKRVWCATAIVSVVANEWKTVLITAAQLPQLLSLDCSLEHDAPASYLTNGTISTLSTPFRLVWWPIRCVLPATSLVSKISALAKSSADQLPITTSDVVYRRRKWNRVTNMTIYGGQQRRRWRVQR